MAKIGLKYVVAAPITAETTAATTYGTGIVVGKAISAGLSVEVNGATLYADNMAAEIIKEFKSGKLTLETDDLTYQVLGILCGHTVTENTLTASKDDMPNDVGVGFFGMVVRNGVKKYRAIWFHKAKFDEPADEMTTTGEKAEFKSSKIEGTILATESGVWKDETLVATETAAIAWLNDKANITGGAE
jgi:phi13 family phage major tail protein